MRARRCLSVFAVTTTLGFSAACGEPATSVSPAPKAPTFLWSTVIFGGAIAADSAAVYLSSNSGEILVLSKQTGLTVRTFSPGLSPSTDGMRMVGNALLLSGGGLRLVDITSGTTRWQYGVSRFDTPLLMDDSVVYVANASTPTVHAVRLSNGTAKWVGDVMPPTTPPPNSTVVVTGGVIDGALYVATFAVINATANPLQSGMVAFDSRTGERKWTIALTDPGSRLGQPALVGGIAVATTAGGVSYGVDVNSGARVWTTAGVGPAPPQPFLSGQAYGVNGIAITTDAGLGRSALDPVSGQRLWRAPDLGVNVSSTSIWAIVIPNGQFVGINTLSELVGLEVSRNPRVVWRYPIQLFDPPVAAATLGDTLFFTTRQRVHAIVVPR